VETWPVTDARKYLPSLLEKVRHGEWQIVGRRGRSEAVLADPIELSALLAGPYRFHPEVIVSQTDIGIWLPELETHATGSTLDEALRELAGVMLEYAEDWEAGLRHAANHRGRLGHVRRIQLAGNEDGVVTMLDADSEAEDAGRA